MPKAEQQTPTEYVILQQHENDSAWEKVATVEARSRNEAIKNGTKRNGNQLEGDFKAIPARSWELTVSVVTETKTVASFSESKNGSSGDGSVEPSPKPLSPVGA